MDTTNTSVTATERYKLNKELAQMLKGGVIMDVTTPEQARIAETAGACAEGRRHYGRNHTGAGEDCRSSRRMCSYGIGAHSG